MPEVGFSSSCLAETILPLLYFLSWQVGETNSSHGDDHYSPFSLLLRSSSESKLKTTKTKIKRSSVKFNAGNRSQLPTILREINLSIQLNL